MNSRERSIEAVEQSVEQPQAQCREICLPERSKYGHQARRERRHRADVRTHSGAEFTCYNVECAIFQFSENRVKHGLELPV